MVNVVLCKKSVHLLILWSARVSNRPFFDIRGSTSFFLPRSPRETMEMIEWWGKTRGVCFKRGSLIGFFNPVIPRVIFGIQLLSTFNPESRPDFALKSRIPSFKQGKSRILRNLMWTLLRGVLVIEVSLKETADCNKGTGTPSNKYEVRL